MKKAELVCMPNCMLAEGCIWNPKERVLYFTDIDGCQVHRFFPETGKLESITTREPSGCLVLHRDGGLVRAEKNRLVRFFMGSDGRIQSETELLRQAFPGYLRYNDGKCDRFGNLWVGTMAVSQSHPGAVAGGSIYCIKGSDIVSAYNGYTIPNGLAWNPSGTIFYHIDTAHQQIDAYDVREEIYLENRRTVVSVPAKEGSPDGMCMDREGNVWVAMWGGKKVTGYCLKSGKKIEEIRVPDSCVSCCCFGGEDYKTLYITTARDGHGMGGQIYAAEMAVAGYGGYEYGGEEG